MILPSINIPFVMSQINGSGSIDGNWFLGIIMLITGFLMVSQIRDIKSELKQNTEVTGQMRVDIGIIKNKLGIK